MGRLLSRGTTGTDVSELQAALNFHVRSPAVPLRPDGIFGPLTQARVLDFQRKARLKADGLVGPATIAALYRQVAGVLTATVTKRAAVPRPGVRQLVPFGPLNPPDVVKPQARRAVSTGFDVESKLVFDPFAKPSQGDQPLQITLSKTIVWPTFLLEPAVLELQPATNGQFQLDGKIKVPFKLIKTDRVELKPYFFVGGGVQQNHFTNLNVGAGTKFTLKLFDLGRGVSVGVEADGGVKYLHDLEKSEGKLKGYGEGSVVLTIPIPGT